MHIRNSESKEARNIIRTIGKEKDSDTQRRSRLGLLSHPTMYKYASNKMDEINDEIKFIARAVMRQPNSTALAILYKIHKKLQSILLKQSNLGLEFLLSEAQGCRGGFKNASQLKRFLNENPANIQPSRLITGIESILTCTIYCRIRSHYFSQFDSRYEINKLINNMIPTLIPHISETYIDRGKDMPFTFASNTEKVQLADVSEASGEDVPAFPTRKETIKFFRLETSSKELTFPGAALENNISVTGHVSGTAPSCLLAVDALLSYDSDKVENIIKSKDEYAILTGALFSASYLRANYHTPAEVYAGLMYYLSYTKDRLDVTDIKNLQPHEAFEGGMKLLACAANDEEKHGAEKNISLKSAIEKTTTDLLLQVGNKQVGQRLRSMP